MTFKVPWSLKLTVLKLSLEGFFFDIPWESFENKSPDLCEIISILEPNES